MRTGLMGAALVGLLLAGAAPARADLYDWTFSGTDNGSGTLTTTGGASPFTVTAITGLFDGNPITELLDPGTCCGGILNSNNLYVPGPYLDVGGIAFSVNGVTENIYYDRYGEVYYSFQDGAGAYLGTFTATAVPEPASATLLGLGLAATALRRRKRLAQSI
jgi:hypothetical protein